MVIKKRQKNKPFDHYTVCPFVVFLWPLYCLSFCGFSFDHYIVCPFVISLCPLYCLSFCHFPLAIILFVLLSFSFGHYIVCPFVVFLWPLHCFSFCHLKEKEKNTNSIIAKGKRQINKQYNGQRKTTKGQRV
jgi:hypothetical protein